MVIFNSYVKLPEGKWNKYTINRKIITPQKNEASFLNLVGVPVHMTFHKHKAEADFLSLWPFSAMDY